MQRNAAAPLRMSHLALQFQDGGAFGPVVARHDEVADHVPRPAGPDRRSQGQGVVLSRSKLGLRIEHSQGRWAVSLVDLATGQAAAVLQIGQLPPDRDAAVQVLVRSTADLAQHLTDQVAKLESRFNPLSLRFAATYRLDVYGGGSSSNRRWVVFRGAVAQKLDPDGHGLVELPFALGEPSGR